MLGPTSEVCRGATVDDASADLAPHCVPCQRRVEKRDMQREMQPYTTLARWNCCPARLGPVGEGH